MRRNAARWYHQAMPTRPSLANFDLNLLLALDALLSERNVTRAAERIHLSQPATSGALQRLREHFGDPLLLRVGRELELTPLALSLLVPVREALLRVRAVLDTEPSFEPKTSTRVFRLVMSDYCTLVFLPGLLARLSSLAPSVRCDVEPITELTYARLDNGSIDGCIMTDDYRLFGLSAESECIRHAPLFVDSFVCVASQARHDFETLDLETFTKLPHVMVHFGGVTTTIVEDALGRSGLKIATIARVPSFTALPFVAAHTGALAVVQRRLTAVLGALLPIRIYEPPFEIPALTEAFMWHTRSDVDPGHAWFRELLLDVGRGLG